MAALNTPNFVRCVFGWRAKRLRNEEARNNETDQRRGLRVHDRQASYNGFSDHSKHAYFSRSFAETQDGEVKFPEISTTILEKICQYFDWSLQYARYFKDNGWSSSSVFESTPQDDSNKEKLIDTLQVLLENDPNATHIMISTGTGLAPFKGYLCRMFLEYVPIFKFGGLALLFLAMANTDSLQYDDEFSKYAQYYPDNYNRVLCKEQKIKNGGKMYVKDKIEDYRERCGIPSLCISDRGCSVPMSYGLLILILMNTSCICFEL